MGSASEKQFDVRARGVDTTGTGRAFYRKSLLASVLGLATCFSVNQAAAQVDPARITAGIVNSAVQAAIEDARERAITATGAPSGRPLAFAPDSNLDATFGALGYAPTKKNPLYAKAPPMPASPGIRAAIWGSGTYDYEHATGTFNGTNIGSNSRAWGGLGGVDFTLLGSSPGTAFLFGFLGGDTDVSVSTAVGTSVKVRAPTAGAYAAYIVGDFSTDFAYTSSWIGADTTVPILGTITTNSIANNFAGNVNYRLNFQNNWWLEPTAGFGWTYTTLGMGLGPEEVLRVQGGARVGTSFKWGAVTVEPTFTGLAYSDVSVTGVTPNSFIGGLPNGASLASTDERQLWGKGIAKFNFVWSPNLSSYIQGEVHGTSGTENVVGYVASVGVRWAF